MTTQTTRVTINGATTELTIGARYRLRYGKNSTMITGGELVERARNGDLVFMDHGDAADFTAKRQPVRHRVRPSAIDAIFENAFEYDGRDGSLEVSAEEEEARIAGEDAIMRAAREGTASCDECGRTDDHQHDAPDFTAKRQPVRHRVRPSAIDAIFEAETPATAAGISAESVPPRIEEEPAAEWMARAEAQAPVAYLRWVETDEGQATLAEARRDADHARRETKAAARKAVKDGLSGILAGATSAADVISGLQSSGVLPAPAVKGKRLRVKMDGKTIKEFVLEPVSEAEAVAALKSRAPGAEPERKTHKVAPEYAPRDPETGLLIGDHVLPEINPNPAYTTHNFIWKCPTCHKRTRSAFCSDGHPPIPQPVGFRAADRTPNHGRTV